MTLWIEWSIIDGDRIGFYIWNNLPDPTGTGKRYGFPNTTFLQYGGQREVLVRGRLLQPDRRRARVQGVAHRRRSPRHAAGPVSLRGIDGWNPEPPQPAFPREEVQAEFEKYRQRAALAVETGDWDQWADQFTDDAHYREHHYGYFSSGAEIRAWIKSVMQPFPTMEFPPSYALIDGNRVSTLIPNILPAPEGDDGYYGFDVNTILHYAGNGKWSFEEDVYSPAEAQDDRQPVDRGRRRDPVELTHHRAARRLRQVHPRRRGRRRGTRGRTTSISPRCVRGTDRGPRRGSS